MTAGADGGGGGERGLVPVSGREREGQPAWAQHSLITAWSKSTTPNPDKPLIGHHAPWSKWAASGTEAGPVADKGSPRGQGHGGTRSCLSSVGTRRQGNAAQTCRSSHEGMIKGQTG